MKEFFPFNVNSNVKVKLTKKGYQHLIKKMNEHSFNDKCVPRLDDQGFYKCQLWTLISDFGEVTSIGFNGCFETEIFLSDEGFDKHLPQYLLDNGGRTMYVEKGFEQPFPISCGDIQTEDDIAQFIMWDLKEIVKPVCDHTRQIRFPIEVVNHQAVNVSSCKVKIVEGICPECGKDVG